MRFAMTCNQLNLLLDSSRVIVPVYVLTSSLSTINEGESVLFSLESQNAEVGTVVPFTLSGMTSGIDYTPVANYSFIVGSRDSITVTTLSDLTTDGAKTLVMSLTGKGVSKSVSVLDTSIAPPPPSPIYTLDSSANSIDEGTNLVFTLGGTNLVNGDVVPFTITGMASGVDYTTLAYTSFIVGTRNTISVAVLLDATTDGQKTFTMALTGKGVSKSVTVNDTSLTATPPPSPAPAPAPAPSGPSVITTGTNIPIIEGNRAYGNFVVTPALAAQVTVGVTVGPSNSPPQVSANDWKLPLYCIYTINGVDQPEIVIPTTGNAGSLDIPAGTTNIKLSVDTLTDNIVEAAEGLLYVISQTQSNYLSNSWYVTSEVTVLDQ